MAAVAQKQHVNQRLVFPLKALRLLTTRQNKLEGRAGRNNMSATEERHRGHKGRARTGRVGSGGQGLWSARGVSGNGNESVSPDEAVRAGTQHSARLLPTEGATHDDLDSFCVFSDADFICTRIEIYRIANAK